MFELIFMDLPLLVAGYAGVVFLILKYMGDKVRDVGTVATEIERPSSSMAKSLIAETEIKESGPVVLEDAQHPLSTPTKGEVASEVMPDFLPTDAQLKRHYLTNLLTIVTTLHPRPQEATLRRHHRQWILSLVEEMLEHPETIERLEDLARERRRQDAPIIEVVSVSQDSPELAGDSTIIDVSQPSLHDNRVTLPEESTLRRHVLQHLLARVEEVFPRPSESTLRRHYDQWLQSEVENLVLHQG